MLDDEPDLSGELAAGGFTLTATPGTWTRSDVPIDLIVPAQLGAVDAAVPVLVLTGTTVARKTAGLEAAVVDHTTIRLDALEGSNDRAFEARVAGVAALLVAKVQKIFDRKDAPERAADKDDLDVLRILRLAEPAALTDTLGSLARYPLASAVTEDAVGHLVDFFKRDAAIGTQIAVRATAALEEEAIVARS